MDYGLLKFHQRFQYNIDKANYNYMLVPCQPDSRHNPFDYLPGQTRVDQEQKAQKEEKDDQGDDKDENYSKILLTIILNGIFYV